MRYQRTMSGTIILLNYFVKKGHNSNNIPFRVMPLVFQLHIVTMSKFGVATFNTFCAMDYIKVFARRRQRRSSDVLFEIVELKIMVC